MDATNRSMMSFVDHVLGVLSSVEFVHIDLLLVGTSKKMTAVGESNLSAAFDSNCLKRLQTILEDIHHPHTISEANNNVETSWMERHTESLITKQLADIKLELSRG